ncbi:MAG: hypothetical protein ACRC3H_16410 [Lachnospiraceae bacterium]
MESEEKQALIFALDLLFIILGAYFLYLNIGNNGMCGAYQMQGEFSQVCWVYLWISILNFLITCTFILVKLKYIHKLKYLRIGMFIVLLTLFSVNWYLPVQTPLTDDAGYYILRTPQSYQWFINEVNSGRSMPNVRLDQDLMLNAVTDWEKWGDSNVT